MQFSQVFGNICHCTVHLYRSLRRFMLFLAWPFSDQQYTIAYKLDGCVNYSLYLGNHLLTQFQIYSRCSGNIKYKLSFPYTYVVYVHYVDLCYFMLDNVHSTLPVVISLLQGSSHVIRLRVHFVARKPKPLFETFYSSIMTIASCIVLLFVRSTFFTSVLQRLVLIWFIFQLDHSPHL